MTTAELIAKIKDKSNKQADIVFEYRQGMKVSFTPGYGIDWEAVNAAIMERWSRSGLRRIKNEAWKGFRQNG